MATKRMEKNWAPSAAEVQEGAVRRIQAVVDFALRKITLSDFDLVVGLSIGGSGSEIWIDQADETEHNRSMVESILVTIATGAAAALPDYRLGVVADRHGTGLHFSPTEGWWPVRWRAIQMALVGQTWRLRICPLQKCRKLFLKRGRSEYCSLQHQGAAARLRRKERLEGKNV
jgi:hypothetical protein